MVILECVVLFAPLADAEPLVLSPCKITLLHAVRLSRRRVRKS